MQAFSASAPRQTGRRNVTVCSISRDEAPMVARRAALAGFAAAAATAGLPMAARAESKMVEKTVPVESLSAFQKV